MFNLFNKWRDFDAKLDITKPVLTFEGKTVQIGQEPKDIFRFKEGILHCIKYAAQMKINSEKAAELALKIGQSKKFVILNRAEYNLLKNVISSYDKAKNPRTGRYESIISVEMGERLKIMVESYYPNKPI